LSIAYPPFEKPTSAYFVSFAKHLSAAASASFAVLELRRVERPTPTQLARVVLARRVRPRDREARAELLRESAEHVAVVRLLRRRRAIIAPVQVHERLRGVRLADARVVVDGGRRLATRDER
jgi:hypothetical protein